MPETIVCDPEYEYVTVDPAKVNWQPVVPVVVVPLMVTVPVEMVMMSLRVVVVAAMVSEPALSVPAPTAMVKFVLLPLGRAMVTKPVMFRVIPELMVREPVFMVVSVLQAAATSTITLIPLLIVTSSEAVGTELPPHVAGRLQFPDTEAILVAASNDDAGTKSKRIRSNCIVNFFFTGEINST